MSKRKKGKPKAPHGPYDNPPISIDAETQGWIASGQTVTLVGYGGGGGGGGAAAGSGGAGGIAGGVFYIGSVDYAFGAGGAGGNGHNGSVSISFTVMKAKCSPFCRECLAVLDPTPDTFCSLCLGYGLVDVEPGEVASWI